MIAQLDRRYFRASKWKSLVRVLSYLMFEGRPLTTKGRWINPIVIGWLRLLAAVPGRTAPERPIYILGTGRSGTTVLGVVLSLHRSLSFLNEPKALWYSAHSGEDVIGSYAPTAGRFRLSAADATPVVRRSMQRLYRRYRGMTCGGQVVDKYPELIFRIPFVQALFPESRFILLQRNGLDTVSSIATWSLRKGSGTGRERHDWWGRNGQKWRTMVTELVPTSALLGRHLREVEALTSDTDKAAVEWILTMEEGLRVAREHSAQVIVLKYESLTAQPRAVLGDLTDKLDLARDERMLRYAETVLTPRGAVDGVRLAPVLCEPFDAMMKACGYAQ